MLLPGLKSYDLGTRHGADALNNLDKENFKADMLEVIRRRAKPLLQES